MSGLCLALACASVLAQEPAPRAISPAAPLPAGPPPPTGSDPAAALFTTPVGLLLVPIKPEKIADYEAVIVALRDVLLHAPDPARRTMAAGWRVYKAAETDANKNALYVHALAPTVPGADYRPSLLLDELLQGAPADLLAKYRDSFAAPPTRLSLTEFAHMGTAPLGKQ